MTSSGGDVSEQPVEVSSSGAVLRGSLTIPDRPVPVPAMVVAHGASHGLRDAALYVELASLLAAEGIAALRYDRRGEGESSGDRETATLEDLGADLTACVRWVQAHPRVHSDRVAAWGISQGGWLVALAAAQEPTLAGIVAVSPSGPGPAEQMMFAVESQMRAAGHSPDEIADALRIRRLMHDWEDDALSTAELQHAIDAVKAKPWFPLAFLPDADESLKSVDRAWSRFDVRPVLEKITAPVLIFFGDRDRWVDVPRSREIWQAHLRQAAVTIVDLPGAGHMATRAYDPESLDPEEAGPRHERYAVSVRNWVRAVLADRR